MSDKKKKTVKEKLVGVGFNPKGTNIVHGSTIRVAKRIDPETLTPRLREIYAKLKDKEEAPLATLADSPHERWSVRMLVGLGLAEAIPPKEPPKAKAAKKSPVRKVKKAAAKPAETKTEGTQARRAA